MQPNLLYELFKRKRELGLKHIIVLHTPMAGVAVPRMMSWMQEMKYCHLKSWGGLLRMDELLEMYGGCSVKYTDLENDDAAFILHTSGTTGGAGKPVALSDKAFNAAVSSFCKMKKLQLPETLITAAIVDLSNAYGMIDQIHLPFAMGATVVLVPGGILNPFFYKAIPHYGITVLFAVSAMFHRWMKQPENRGLQFDSLRLVIFGGAAVSASDKQRFYEFMVRHGGKEIQLRNGYGISELGGACCLSSEDLSDEAIGFPLEGVELRLYDEEKGIFYSEKDAPCEGVLYMNAPAMANILLDGKEVLKVETIDGKKFICTNDLAGIDKTGKLTFLGRANRFFLHDDGIKYESGRVETELARQAGIESCCIVPVYIKTTYDNIPMLCAKTVGEETESGHRRGPDDEQKTAKEILHKALRTVFITEKTLPPEDIPHRVRIVKEFPKNANGKIDLYKVNRGEVEGDIFTVDVARIGGRITDIRLTPHTERSEDMIQEVFDGISAEIKSKLPFKNINYKVQEQEANMKDVKKMMDEFNMMNEQGKKKMMEMMGKMGGMNMPQGMKMPFGDFMKRMPDMDQMNKMMGEQMKQMLAGMQEMNKTALHMMQQMFEQNCRMTEQFFDMMQKMNSRLTGFDVKEGKEEKAVQPDEDAPKKAPKKKATAKTSRAKK